MGRLVAAVLGLLILGSCSGGTERSTPDVASTETKPSATAAVATAAPVTTEAVATTTTVAPTTSTTTPVTTTTTSTTVAPDTTTATVVTTAPAPAPAPEPVVCVLEVKPGDSLSLIAATIADEAVTVAGLQAENALADPNTINAGDVLDVCVGNEVDDLTGQPRVPPTIPPAVAAAATGSGVAAQQQKLNELFAGSGLPALAVDGNSGRLTRQQLCAARVALGLPISRADVEPGGAEEVALMAAGSLPIPGGAPVSAGRWALIDKTCQVMFVGEGGSRIVFVFQTSTGEAGYETRNQNGSRAFRYDPARASNGWHNSIDYPVPGDNPLNGNMYLPVYFDGGQAIHGANNVPTEPRSKGCARLRVESQRAFVDWLGLGDVGGPIWNDPGRIDLSVSVQGRY